jgi:creatinine amidohydrolase
MFFYDVTSSQVANLNRTAVVLIPFGAVEQHSLHLPLGTDSIIGEAIARRLKQELSRQILVLPFTWLGSSRHHMGFPGSVTAEIETLIDVGVELGSSVAAHGFRNFILLNSHGGDINKVAVIAEKLRYRPNPVLKVVAVTYWHLIAKEIRDIRETPLGGMGHAGELETSAMLAVSPEHVRQDMMGADGQEKFSQFEGSDMFSP